jgi:hypothetical protein
MFLAATGCFAFTYFILFRLNPSETRVFSRFPFDLFNVLYAAILISSALLDAADVIRIGRIQPRFRKGSEDRTGDGWISLCCSAICLIESRAAPASMGPPAGRGRMCGFLSPDGHPGRDRMGGILYSLNKNLLIPLRV